MISTNILKVGTALTIVFLLTKATSPSSALAQEQPAAVDTSASVEQSPEPLSADELEILVARIALYPDELVALVSGAALYPLQIVEASRFLDDYAKDKTLKPKEGWDGSVISLLNYPEIVRMMSDDLEWTQELGTALAYQQKDVLIAIQQLREEAVAKGVIKSDGKVKVVTENDNIVIQPGSTETVYVPRYEPEMLYVPTYVPAPVSYYPDPYPHYWYPAATFFAGAVTGAVWGAVIDWDDWDVWGGHWDGGNIEIECNHCFNNNDFDGKIDFNKVDWKNVDRTKIKLDKSQLTKFDRTSVKNKLKAGDNNAIRNRAADFRKQEASPSRRIDRSKDVRKSTLEGLQKAPGGTQGNKKAAIGKAPRLDASKAPRDKLAKTSRPSGKLKPAAKLDKRPKKPSGLGDMDRGKITELQSIRGTKALGGGQRGGKNRIVRRGGRRR